VNILPVEEDVAADWRGLNFDERLFTVCGASVAGMAGGCGGAEFMVFSRDNVRGRSAGVSVNNLVARRGWGKA
jgi:hypothetical protein